jgi:hypothetical protein
MQSFIFFRKLSAETQVTCLLVAVVGVPFLLIMVLVALSARDATASLDRTANLSEARDTAAAIDLTLRTDVEDLIAMAAWPIFARALASPVQGIEVHGTLAVIHLQKGMNAISLVSVTGTVMGSSDLRLVGRDESAPTSGAPSSRRECASRRCAPRSHADLSRRHREWSQSPAVATTL